MTPFRGRTRNIPRVGDVFKFGSFDVGGLCPAVAPCGSVHLFTFFRVVVCGLWFVCCWCCCGFIPSSCPMWFRSFVHLLSCRCGRLVCVAVVSSPAVAPCGSVHLFTFFRVVVVGWFVLLWFHPQLLPHVVPFICSPSFVSLWLPFVSFGVSLMR
jgi:hypothetical protein